MELQPKISPLPPAGIGGLLVGETQEVVHAGAVKDGQRRNHLQRVVERAGLILGIGILLDLSLIHI